ncbi:transposable element Tcb2 transposase [Trichonephila clavipes]|nr:transposable element Tcb2 transposase [Trichonephila clavipes]
MANNQSVRRHLNAFTRGRIIGKMEEGRSVTSVAAQFGIAHSIVSRLWRQFQTTGTAIRGFRSGRPRATTPADDRYIVLQARRNRRQTAGEIARHTTQATERPISRFTVARRLHGGGLFARRPVRCVPLTPAHRRKRSLWCREHRNWRGNESGRVLFFTDESRFSLSSDSHRILIWRERGSRNHPSNIIERDRGAMGLQFLFMDDNAPCHRTVAAEQLLESRRLAARTLPPVMIRELRLALQDEWAAMPQQLNDTLILSMGRRCETCLAVREIISPTKDRMFLAGHPSQACFGLQSHCAPCYFFNQASFYPSDFSFIMPNVARKKSTKVAEAVSIEQRSGKSQTTRKAAVVEKIGKFDNSLVYADKSQTLDHLEDNIRRVIADIRPQMLEKVIENWTSRLDYIRASRGSPMPEIIFKM